VHIGESKAKWAETFYQRALAADPTYALAEVGLAKLALLYNDRILCEEHLQKAAALEPKDPEVKKAIDAVRNPKPAAVKKPQTDEGEKKAATAEKPMDPKKERKKRR